MPVRRLLPRRACRRVGAWVFLDHFGPTDGSAMHVPPHPHIGLQTVTWLLEGEVEHLDSLGSRQVIRPGQLNWMTAGEGIVHAELGRHGRAHGVQLWVALPREAAHGAPSFAHHAALPEVVRDGARVTVLAGTVAGATSPAVTHTPLSAADLRLDAGTDLAWSLEPAHEHGVAVLEGEVVVAGHALAPGVLLYLPPGTPAVQLVATGPARLMVIGGAPLDDELVLYWNFVARSREEVVEAVARWRNGGFARVPGYDGPGLPAPPEPAPTLRAVAPWGPSEGSP
ncbi:MAG: pirin family protein [Alphaproteobacteria bacterium]|nr:pirin family protein [Alphaproteobacteria bacterium]